MAIAPPIPLGAPLTLGGRLCAARRASRYSQSAAAEAAGVHQTTVATWERGDREPRASQLAALADLYDVTVAHLLGREART